MNKAASQLGKLAAGVPKQFSAEEIAKRTARLRKAQKERAKTQRALRRSNNQPECCPKQTVRACNNWVTTTRKVQTYETHLA